MFDKSV